MLLQEEKAAMEEQRREKMKNFFMITPQLQDSDG